MTINAPAAIILAFYLVVAERQGVPWDKLRGTIQNDILKEFHAQNEFVFPPRESVRLVIDTIEFCTRHVPQFNPVSISGYHIREAGSTAAEELAFTLADGFHYVEADARARAGRSMSSPRGCRSSSTATTTSWRRSPSSAPPGGFGPGTCATATARPDPRSWMLRFHAQTSGVSLQAQQPEVNVIRVAYQAMAAVLGGCQIAAHQQPRRDAVAADRRSGDDRPAHAAGAGPRDGRAQLGRSAGRQLHAREADR